VKEEKNPGSIEEEDNASVIPKDEGNKRTAE